MKLMARGGCDQEHTDNQENPERKHFVGLNRPPTANHQDWCLAKIPVVQRRV